MMMGDILPDVMYSVKDAARMLDMDYDKMRRYVSSGRIRGNVKVVEGPSSVSVLRVPGSELIRFIEEEREAKARAEAIALAEAAAKAREAAEAKAREEAVPDDGEAAQTEPEPPDVAHARICAELHDTYRAKNTDYGDAFSKTFAEEGLAAARVRLTDKLERFKTLSRGNEPAVNTESIVDTLKDLANYAIMTVIEIERSGKEE